MKRLDRIDVSDQWCNRDLSTGVNKKRNGITILAATVNDPMRRRGKEAIAPGFHDVADVNNKSIFNRRRTDPFAVFILHLEPPDFVLSENCEPP